MRHLIKTISLILTVALLMTGVVFATETTNADYDSYIRLEDIFRGIGVLTADDVFVEDYSADITEDDFNKMILNLTGTDCTDKSEGAFNFNRAVKKVITLLGYDVVAVERGPYPDGYIKVGHEIDLFEGVALKGEKTISVGEAMRLLYNAMHINVVDRTVYGDEAKYQIIDETLLTLYKKLYFKAGIVTDNAITDFEGVSQLDKDEIKIDGILYKGDSNRYADLIGKVIGVYYRIDENGVRNIVYAAEEPEKYNSIKIWAKDILGYSNLSFAYSIGDNGKIINLRPSIIVIHNNIATTTYGDTIFKPDSGYVEFIDNNSDAVYDVAIVKSYSNVIVRAVNAPELLVKDLNNRDNNINLEDKEDRYIIKTTKNEIVGFDYLEEYDVLSVAKAENDAFIEIIVSNKFASGDVNFVYFNSTEKKVRIGNKEYLVDKGYTNFANEIKSGMYGRALLDFEGDIVFFADESKSARYGYIIEGTESNTGFEEKIKLKLLTQDNEIAIYECSEKVTVDEVELDTSAEIKTQLKDNGKYKQQMIMYKLNSDGKIRMIDTAMDLTQDISPFTTDEVAEKEHLRLYAKAKSGVYLNGTLDATVMLNSNTKVFIVGTSGVTDEEFFKVAERTNLVSGTSQGSYDVYTNNIECMSADVLLTTTDITMTSSYSGRTQASLIQGIGKALNEDGKPVDIIYAIQNNKEVEILVNEKHSSAVNVMAGDVARIDIDSNGQAVKSTLVYRKGNVFNSVGGFSSMFYAVTGRVYNCAQNVIQLTQLDVSALSRTKIPSDSKYISDAAPMYLWDSTEQKFKNITAQEINDYKYDNSPDTMTIVMKNGTPNLIVVYR